MEEYYEEDKEFDVALELPVDIKEQVGSGSLSIELEIETRDQDGWKEHVELYTKPPNGCNATSLNLAYKLHTSPMDWDDAEAECQMKGVILHL